MSFFSHRNDGNGYKRGMSVLTDDNLRELAPSVFAEQAHESRSSKFAYISTREVVDGLRENGFVPTFAKQGNSRVAGKADFTKHMIRFRHESSGMIRTLGAVYPEVVLVNAHDGTASYHLDGGLWRLVCLNGNVVCDSRFASLQIAHKGDIISKVIEGSFEVIEDSKRALERAGEWSGVTLNHDEQLLLAQGVHTVRFADHEGNVETPITPEQFLRVRRVEDRLQDLWTISQRIQENAIRGGLTAMGRDANNHARRVTTREVKGIDGDVRLNKAIWALTEQMAALKGAA
jgi:Domain of unknown function (DUF932)